MAVIERAPAPVRADAPLTDEQRALVEKNLPLVKYTLKLCYRQHCRPGPIMYDEAMSAAMLGLVDAVRTFCPDRGSLSNWIVSKICGRVRCAARVHARGGLTCTSEIPAADRPRIRSAGDHVHRLASRYDYSTWHHADDAPDPKLRRLLRVRNDDLPPGVRRVKHGYQARVWLSRHRVSFNLGYFTTAACGGELAAIRRAAEVCAAWRLAHRDGRDPRETFDELKARGVIAPNIAPPGSGRAVSKVLGECCEKAA